MGLVADLLEDAIKKIADNDYLILQEDFMMNIFCPLQDKIESSFDECLTFIVEEK